MTLRTLVFAALLACACGIPDEGPMMAPGQDCAECHGRGEAPGWTASGTVFNGIADRVDDGVRGARVTLTDAGGRSVSLRTNAAGNFYTRERLAYPLRSARVERGDTVRVMLDVPRGGCNGCHTSPAPQRDRAPRGRIALVGGAIAGPLMNPGEDCIACHAREGGPTFQVAGTVYASSSTGAGEPGVAVTLTGSDSRTTTLLSNAAGNFYYPDPLAPSGPALAFPLRVRIAKGVLGQEMEERIESPGSCNRCHQPGGEGENRVSLEGREDHGQE